MLCGEMIMKGYWNWFEEIVEMMCNGWLYIGDFVKLDVDGYIMFVDWFKDLIIIGGCNVYLVEVENVFVVY